MRHVNLNELTEGIEELRVAVEEVERLRASQPDPGHGELEHARELTRAALAEVYTQLGVPLTPDDLVVQESERWAQRALDALEWLLAKEKQLRNIVQRAATPQCPGRAPSLLAWVHYLAWLVLCGLLVQCFCWVGHPPYTTSFHILLLVTWTLCVVQGILLITHIFGSLDSYVPYVIGVLTSAIALVVKDEMSAREADITMLDAVQDEAERKAGELPSASGLHHVAAEFGVSVRARRAAAERALNTVHNSRYRIDRFLQRLRGIQTA